MGIIFRVIASVVIFLLAMIAAAAGIEIASGARRPGLVPLATLLIVAPFLFVIWENRLPRQRGSLIPLTGEKQISQHLTSQDQDKDQVPILGQSKSFPWIVFVPVMILLVLATLIKLSTKQDKTPVSELQNPHEYDDVFRKFWDSPAAGELPPRVLRDQKSDKLPSY